MTVVKRWRDDFGYRAGCKEEGCGWLSDPSRSALQRDLLVGDHRRHHQLVAGRSAAAGDVGAAPLSAAATGGVSGSPLACSPSGPDLCSSPGSDPRTTTDTP